MPSRSQRNSGRGSRFALFLLFACLANNRMTRRRLRMEALGTSRTFSAWLRGWCGGAQLCQKRGQRWAQLGEGQNRAARFPGPIDACNQGTCQKQLVVRASDDLCPPFRLLWGAQAWLVPEQDLLIQAETMLVRVTQAIGRADLSQGGGFVTFPDEPTRLGIARTFAGPMTDDLDNAHLHPSGATQMQLVPAVHFHALARAIRALPTRIRFAMGAGITALKTCSIFATRPALTRLASGGRMVKDAIAFDAQQATGCHIGHACQKRSASIPAVADDDWSQSALDQQIDDGWYACAPFLARMTDVAASCLL